MSYTRRVQRDRQLMFMLLVTNLYFLLSALPYSVSFIMFQGEKSESALWQSLIHLVLYTNNALNFVFYGLSSEKYRECCAEIFCRLRSKKAASSAEAQL